MNEDEYWQTEISDLELDRLADAGEVYLEDEKPAYQKAIERCMAQDLRPEVKEMLSRYFKRLMG